MPGRARQLRLESSRDGICAADAEAVDLQKRAIVAVNAGLVPTELQEELLGRINALNEAVSCEPPDADAGAAEDARGLADWIRERGSS